MEWSCCVALLSGRLKPQHFLQATNTDLHHDKTSTKTQPITISSRCPAIAFQRQVDLHWLLVPPDIHRLTAPKTHGSPHQPTTGPYNVVLQNTSLHCNAIKQTFSGRPGSKIFIHNIQPLTYCNIQHLTVLLSKLSFSGRHPN